MRINLLMFVIGVITANLTKAQETDSTTMEYEVAAEFPGGANEFYSYVASTLKYPKKARKEGIGGRVLIEFFIKEDGTIDQDSIRALPIEEIEKRLENLSRVTTNALLVNEAIRVVRLSPKWIPGSRRKVPVKQKIVFPFNFVPF